MIKKVLIANRGEIAVRIIRACRELSIETVAVYSLDDEFSLHVHMADEAYCIGKTSPKESYLNIINIVEIAVKTNCDAVHPGYGFLAENDAFAEICRECNIIFIGPSPEVINKLGLKDIARAYMKSVGVPILPGSDGVVSSDEEAIAVARECGYPVIIKASAGGGGRGIRVAYDEESLINGIQITRQEAEVSFGNGAVYIEKYVESFRHVEIQVLADHHGNAIHLGERDCSIQRRLQKLVEEAPSPSITPEIRQAMGKVAVNAVLSLKYFNAGTFEFIFDVKNNKFYFMEMNTRIQVEHPVTEMITGVDIVKEQILIASGERLTIKQSDIKYNGWSIECRINAEDPQKNFIPTPGTIVDYLAPGGLGVRVDSAMFSGCVISPYYDSMIAKLIVHAPSRGEAIAKMKRALEEYVIGGKGISTTIPFHIQLMKNKKFIENNFDTKFLETNDVFA